MVQKRRNPTGRKRRKNHVEGSSAASRMARSKESDAGRGFSDKVQNVCLKPFEQV
jgi:hypothetical protein